MSGQLPRHDALDLELAALAAELEWPATPRIADSVAATLAADPARAGGWWRGGWRPARRALLLAVLAAVLLIGLAAGIGFALGGLKIIFGGSPPGSPLPPELVAERGLGQRTDLESAAAHLGGLFVPTDPALGAPDHVYFDSRTSSVALAWGSRPGLPADPATGLGIVVTQLRADVTAGTFVKLLHEDAVLDTTNVRGAPAYWISGGDHFFFYVDPNDQPVEGTLRVVGNALVWEREGITLRIEGAPTLADAVRIGESMQIRLPAGS
ncbi:MAG TPA: hypothetical protein VF153_01645 [Candidatus Limnocylindria bacterium]